MTTHISLSATVPNTLAGSRLDQIAAQLFPDYSRSRLQTWIKEGSLLVNNQPLRSRDRLSEGDLLEINTQMPTNDQWTAEELPIEIVYEDDDLVIINKAAGVVVHPAAGNREGTLLNGLLSKIPQLEELPRAGIIHRLDKDTTGLLIVAKNLIAHTRLVAMLQVRDISREYQAIVQGVFTGGGRIDQPLGRHPINRKKRAVVREGKEAVTHYKIAKRFRCHTLVDVKLETGRTHQIRVHMASIKSPIVGDPLYGGRLQLPRACHENLAKQLQQFKRQALHAKRLAFNHPITEKPLEFQAPLPNDMLLLLEALAEDMRAEQL